MTKTAKQLCTSALWASGVVGQGIEPMAEDISVAFELLNEMLELWSSRRWLVYRLVDNSFVCTGAINYTIGPGGNINVTDRPDRVETAYVRLLTTPTPSLRTDYPLEQILAREDYSRITLKQMQSFPDSFFYDPAYPQGFIYVYPIPTAQYELHVVTREILAAIANLTDTVLLPRVYNGVIKWNLAKRIRVAYRYKGDSEINKLAQDGINVISSNNFAVPTLEIPAELRGGGRYNFYSDTMGSGR